VIIIFSALRFGVKDRVSGNSESFGVKNQNFIYNYLLLLRLGTKDILGTIDLNSDFWKKKIGES
jgi:hypothetical protein